VGFGVGVARRTVPDAQSGKRRKNIMHLHAITNDGFELIVISPSKVLFI
jgi:hypothetical protein